MKKIYIDLNSIETEKDFHKYISKKLGFPDYYGGNMDALWDCLSSEIEIPVYITLDGVDRFKNKLGSAGELIINIFFQAATEIDGFNVVLSKPSSSSQTPSKDAASTGTSDASK